jgi:histidine ammonia-lyase
LIDKLTLKVSFFVHWEKIVMETVILTGENLTPDQVIAVAHGQPGQPQVRLAEEAMAQVHRAAEAVTRLLERGEVAYGITTGFGAFKDRVIPLEQVAELQRNIVMSHAVGVGPAFDIPSTRAIMLIRANTLARGYSGIRLETLQLLLDLLNSGIHPLIPEKGSLGASGDLAPLAHMSLVLIGEGEAEYKGEILPGAEALRRTKLQPVQLAAKEGLALTNGTAVMCALGALEAYHARLLSRVADIAGCLSLEALHGTPLAFDPRIHQLRPHPRQLNCAAYLRELLAGSDFTRHHDPRNVQDAYTLRCIPQVHGAIRDAIAYARWVIEIELNSVTDNPLIFINDDTAEIEVLSGGNFHGEILAIAMDYLAMAMAELGNISERRVMRLTDEASNAQTLPAFLTRQGGLNSGFMITQYTAAALATENKVLAHPASVDTIPTSANVEDHASMGCTAALQARQIIKNVERILAIELMAAAQGIDFRKEKLGQTAQLGQGTQPAYDLIRKHVPFLEKDAIMYPYIEAIRKLIANGDIVIAVNKQVQDIWEV